MSPTTNEHAMTARMVRMIGVLNVAVGVVAMAALLASYGLAEGLVSSQERAAEGTIVTHSVDVLGTNFAISLSMSILLLGAAAGLVGSMIQQSIVFAHRAGHETLEVGFVWWYLLRPIWSALLGAVFVIAVNTGLISIGDQTTSSDGITVLATVGCFAGLFTDQVLDRMRDLLGATDPTVPVVGAAEVAEA